MQKKPKKCCIKLKPVGQEYKCSSEVVHVFSKLVDGIHDIHDMSVLNTEENSKRTIYNIHIQNEDNL